MSTEPTVVGILETSLYVEDMPRATAFYDRLFGFPKMIDAERLCAYSISGRGVFLLFKRGATVLPVSWPGGILPPHDGSGQYHMAFSITAGAWDGWIERLKAQNVAVESVVNWDSGGRSLYFRDPDGNLLELATPGTWPIY